METWLIKLLAIVDWTELSVLLPTLEVKGWRWKFQPSTHALVFPATSPHPKLSRNLHLPSSAAYLTKPNIYISYYVTHQKVSLKNMVSLAHMDQ